MTPKKLTTRQEARSVAVGRRRIAQKYLEVAELIATEDGTAINVAVGLAVLAGIAAADSICIAATGERYSGQDHAAAAELLGRVDRNLGRRLRDLVDLKPASITARVSSTSGTEPRQSAPHGPWSTTRPTAPPDQPAALVRLCSRATSGVTSEQLPTGRGILVRPAGRRRRTGCRYRAAWAQATQWQWMVVTDEPFDAHRWQAADSVSAVGSSAQFCTLPGMPSLAAAARRGPNRARRGANGTLGTLRRNDHST